MRTRNELTRTRNGLTSVLVFWSVLYGGRALFPFPGKDQFLYWASIAFSAMCGLLAVYAWCSCPEMPTDDILDERPKDSWQPTDGGTKPPGQDDGSDE
jgi:hypothetical protein